MLFDKFKFKMDKYIYENWSFRIITLGLLGVIIFQQYLISNRINNKRIVFMPPKIITKQFWVAGNQVSKTYLQEMGKFIVFNLMNITKEFAKDNMNNLLILVPPSHYYNIKASLMQQMKYVTENAISRIFFPSRVDVNKKGLIKVIGIVKDIISDNIIKSEQNTIEIRYRIIQGRFWIYSIKVSKR